jgi:hypothetical protein
MSALTEAQAHVRRQRTLVGALRTLLADAEVSLERAQDYARSLAEREWPRWLWLRLDELRLGDRVEWVEFHEGPMTVTHLGRVGDQIELGTDIWGVDQLLPPWERVRVDADRPDLDEEAPA